MEVGVCHYTCTSAAGVGMEALRRSLRDRKTGLRRNDLQDCNLDTWIGRVEGVEEVELPGELQHLLSRNNQLAWLGLQQNDFLSHVEALKSRVGTTRLGVIMGTSTSSIGRTEEGYAKLDGLDRMPAAYRQPAVHNLHSPGYFVAAATGLGGPAMTISTACSSSAKVFAAAARWIECGVADAVLVGGVDSLCLSILYGFNSLELISPNPCRPFDQRRDGINIGEACGFALLAGREFSQSAELELMGYGESSDAYHMSHPHPQGKGAILAIDQAVRRAGVRAADIGYVNLHGTASNVNDVVETEAMAERFPASTRASSTKGWTGHALGAAGILESVIALDALSTGLMPGTLNCETPDPAFRFQVATENHEAPVRYSMNNSFGFGGSNASLIFGRRHD
jgi:3-oxoacyl-[acyl-carrier-protein] synthase-1